MARNIRTRRQHNGKRQSRRQAPMIAAAARLRARIASLMHDARTLPDTHSLRMPVGLLLTALVAVGSVLIARPPVAAATPAPAHGPTSHPVVLAAPQPPDVAHFVDNQDGTALTLRLLPAGNEVAGQFTLAISSSPKQPILTGAQIRGFLPLAPQPDGTLVQADVSGATPAPIATSGLLYLANNAPAGVATSLATRGGGPLKVAFTWFARIEPHGLGAYATLTAPSLSFVLASGCTPDACADPLASAGQTVQQYGTAVTQGDWPTAYALSSSVLTGQYTSQEFTSFLSQQADSVGKITNIASDSGPVTVQFDNGGQAYFAVKQTITLNHAGATSTRAVASYFLLEGGQWHFWFSA
jgi:hypothetical protein